MNQIAQMDPIEEEKVDTSLQTYDMWTDHYSPKRIEDLVGNQGSVNSLFEWLKDWEDVHIRGNKK